MDRGLAELLQKERSRLLDADKAMLERVVFRCVAAKALIVAKDEREKRSPRNPQLRPHSGPRARGGHGFRISHGRAVAFGMRVAARMALVDGPVQQAPGRNAGRASHAYGLPDRVPHVDPARVLAAIPRDKKARRGKVAWVMPRRMGHAEPGHTVPSPLVRRVVTRALA